MNTYDQENKFSNINLSQIASENIQTVTNCSETDSISSNIPKLLAVPAKKASNVSDISLGIVPHLNSNKDTKLHLNSSNSNFNKCQPDFDNINYLNMFNIGFHNVSFGLQDKASQTDLTGNEIDDLLYTKLNVGKNTLSLTSLVNNSCDLRKVLNGFFKERSCPSKPNFNINRNFKLFNNLFNNAKDKKASVKSSIVNEVNDNFESSKDIKNFINIKRNPDRESTNKQNKKKATNSLFAKNKNRDENRNIKHSDHIHLKNKKEKRKYRKSEVNSKNQNDLKIKKQDSLNFNEISEQSCNNSITASILNNKSLNIQRERPSNVNNEDESGNNLSEIEAIIRKLKNNPNKTEETHKNEVNFRF